MENEKQCYLRHAVLFGFFVQLRRLYTDTMQKLPTNSESNIMRCSTVPRFKYLPIRFILRFFIYILVSIFCIILCNLNANWLIDLEFWYTVLLYYLQRGQISHLYQHLKTTYQGIPGEITHKKSSPAILIWMIIQVQGSQHLS